MINPPPGAIAVIFLSGSSDTDTEGYHAVATVMEETVARRDGYLGIDSTRGADGVGITISWRSHEEAAIAWRNDPDHMRIRELGRVIWYDWYRVIIATVDCAYDWQKPYRVSFYARPFCRSLHNVTEAECIQRKHPRKKSRPEGRPKF